MKKITSLLCVVLFHYISASAQSFAINTDGSAANASALLDVKSTVKGMLIPRMTRAERNAIAAPATGLLIFQNAPDSIGFYYYNGSSWTWLLSNANSDVLAWKTGGNAGTIDGSHFIGTTDNIPLTIKVNNQKSGRIDPTAGNNFFGYQSGFFTNTGVGNSAFGHQNLFVNSAGSNNTSMGRQALYFNSTGSSNTALGYAATIYNSVGNNNTSLGFYSLYNNVAGSNGLAIGYQAMLYANNTATPFTNYNMAVGYEALKGSATPAANTGNYNTALGYQTLWSNTTGNHNNAIGNAALYSNTTGNWNTATGDSALYQNISGGWNTATGFQAMRSNTSGSSNVSVGYHSLFSNTTGYGNTATGSSSLLQNTNGYENTSAGLNSMYFNTSGYSNTAYGSYTLTHNITGIKNVAVGHNAMYYGYGSYNVALGSDALYYNTGNSNIAIGYQSSYNSLNTTYNISIGDSSMYTNVAGRNGTAIGARAMYNYYGSASAFTNFNVALGFEALKSSSTPANNTGNFNTALGYQTLWSNSTGGQNTAAGHQSLYSNTTGNNSAAYGYGSLSNNTTGGANTAIGYFSLNSNNSGTFNTGTGVGSLQSNTAGVGNTAIGAGSLWSNSTGDGNIGIGYYAGPITSGLNNTTTIGYNASVSASNTMQFGNNAVTDIYAGVGTAATLHAGYGVIEKDLTIDNQNLNNGTITNGLHFGTASGEVIASKRTAGGNQWGLDFYTNSINRMSIGFNGYVGIGTSGPAALLDISGAESAAHGAGAAIKLSNTAAGSGNSWTFRTGATGTATPAGGFSIGDNAAYRFVITNAGDVGIGNTAPSAKLDVTGITTTDGLQVSNGTVLTKMQSGSVTVGSSGTAQLVYTITFPVAFASATPRVFASARNEPASAFTDAFSVSVRSVTATTVTLNIQRTDSISGWAQQLRVDWFAVE